MTESGACRGGEPKGSGDDSGDAAKGAGVACWGDEARDSVEVNKEACEVGKIRDGGSLRGGVTTGEGGTYRGGEEEGEGETGGEMARNRVSCKGGVVRLVGVSWRRRGDPEKLAGKGGVVRADRVDGEGVTRGVG